MSNAEENLYQIQKRTAQITPFLFCFNPKSKDGIQTGLNSVEKVLPQTIENHKHFSSKEELGILSKSVVDLH